MLLDGYAWKSLLGTSFVPHVPKRLQIVATHVPTDFQDVMNLFQNPWFQDKCVPSSRHRVQAFHSEESYRLHELDLIWGEDSIHILWNNKFGKRLIIRKKCNEISTYISARIGGEICKIVPHYTEEGILLDMEQAIHQMDGQYRLVIDFRQAASLFLRLLRVSPTGRKAKPLKSH